MPFGPSVLLLAVLAPRLARAAEYTVDPAGGGDYLTIGEAVSASVSGDTIWVEAGVYGERVIFDGKDVSLRSLAGAAATVITPTWDYAVWYSGGVSSAALLEGFTLTAPGTAAVAISASSPLIRDCVFTGNAGNLGGGLYVVGGSPTLEGDTFLGNTADHGADAYITGSAAVTFQDCTFSNGAGWSGGSLTIYQASATLSSCAFSGASAQNAGGAIRADYATLTLQDVTFDSCTAGSGSFGGAIYASETTLSMTDCAVSHSSAGQGGAMILTTGAVELIGSTFSANSASEGGAIVTIGADLTVEDCAFLDNDSRLWPSFRPFGLHDDHRLPLLAGVGCPPPHR